MTKKIQQGIDSNRMKKVILEKTKNIVREVCLYFIDWVIE